MNYFIMLVAVKRGGVREIKNAKHKMNLIFLRWQDKIYSLLPIRLNEKLKI